MRNIDGLRDHLQINSDILYFSLVIILGEKICGI